jgi:4-amino-4-deoxy-L-arabinose transferase-like glycosyltransferase
LYYVFQLSTAVGIIWLTYAIADRWFGSQTAMVAAVLVALEPGLILYHAYKVDDIALGTFLLLLGVHVFALMTLSHDGHLACLTGLIMGIGVLTRPDLLGVFGVLPAWAIFERKRLVIIFKPALLIILAAALVWAPWAIRNYLVQRQFVLLTTYSGESLWRGNNPNSTGTTVTLENQGQFEAAPVEFRNKIFAATEMQKDALFKEEAFRFIAEDPAGFLWRVLKKFYFFWWFTPTFAARYYEWVPLPFAQLYRLIYGVLLAFAFLGMWAVMRETDSGTRRITLFLLAIPIVIAVIHSISYVEGRHRVLVMPFILIITAYGITLLGNWQIHGKRHA